MRLRNSLINVIVTVIFSVLTGVVGLFKTRIFLENFGMEINGFVSLSNQISLAISLLEAGIGGIFIQRMFTLLVDKNHQGIVDLYETVKKLTVFIIVIVTIICIGYSFVYIKNYSYLFPTWEVFIIYWLTFLPTIAILQLQIPVYVLIADQKDYYYTGLVQLFNIITFVLQIIVILYSNSVILYSVVLFFGRLIPYFILKSISIKKYSFLKEVKKSKNYFDTSIIKQLYYSFGSSLSSLITQQTDSILIAYVLNLGNTMRLNIISQLSIYNGVILLVQATVEGVFTKVIASFGNLFASKEKNANEIFIIYLKICFLISSVIYVSLFSCIQSFILIYTGVADVLFNMNIVFFLLLNSLIFLLKIPFVMIIGRIFGEFKILRNAQLIEAVLNLVISLTLINKIGVIGLFIGTFISSFVVNIVVLPKITFNILEINISKYIFIVINNGFITFICGYIGFFLFSMLSTASLITWFFNSILVFGMISILEFIIYFYVYNDFKCFVYDLLVKGKVLLKMKFQKNKIN